MVKLTIEDLRTKDVVGVPIDMAVYQTKDITKTLSKEQMIEIVAQKSAEEIATQIQLSELYHSQTHLAAESKPYPLANLGLASQMPEKMSNKLSLVIGNSIDRVFDWSVLSSPVAEGIFSALIAEIIMFGSAYLVAHFMFGWF
jgi:hypothetical protein